MANFLTEAFVSLRRKSGAAASCWFATGRFVLFWQTAKVFSTAVPQVHAHQMQSCVSSMQARVRHLTCNWVRMTSKPHESGNSRYLFASQLSSYIHHIKEKTIFSPLRSIVKTWSKGEKMFFLYERKKCPSYIWMPLLYIYICIYKILLYIIFLV